MAEYEKRTDTYEGPNRRLKSSTVETVRGIYPPSSNAYISDDGAWMLFFFALCCILVVFLFIPFIGFWDDDDQCCNCGGWNNCYDNGCGGGGGGWPDDDGFCRGPFSADMPMATDSVGSCEGRFLAAANKRKAEHRKAAEAAWNSTRDAARRGPLFASCERRRSRDRSKEWKAARTLFSRGDLSHAVAAMGAARLPLPFSAVRNGSVLTIRASGKPLCANEIKCEGSAAFFARFFREALLQQHDPADVEAIDAYAARAEGPLADASAMTADQARAAFRAAGVDLVAAFGGGLSQVRFERGARHASVGVFRRFSPEQIRTYMLASFHLFTYSRGHGLDCAAVGMLLSDSKAKMRDDAFLDNVLLARRSLFDRNTRPPASASRRREGRGEQHRGRMRPESGSLSNGNGPSVR